MLNKALRLPVGAVARDILRSVYNPKVVGYSSCILVHGIDQPVK